MKSLRINDDLSLPVIVHAAKADWMPSPAAGVERRMLFRIGGEVARATSIVRYAPGSVFPRHTHGGGEEVLVLDGTFQDEHGDFPAGSYFRNPPGTSHVPATKEGCTIFVRLCQFRSGDRAHTVHLPGQGQQVEPRPGAARATILFNDGREEVRLEDWRADASIVVPNARGLEFFVLAGGLTLGRETLEPLTWGRLPAGMNLNARVGAQGASLWMKDAPLLHPDICALQS